MKRYYTISCIIIAVICATNATWIQAKGLVGQMLLETAWQASIGNKDVKKPWPWADTWPVAKLTIPTLEKSFVVLEGVSGEAMAFGPGRIEQLSNTAKSGVYGIGGHRDSHLSFLKHLPLNSDLQLQTIDGQQTLYRITNTFVADSAQEKLMISNTEHALILITCFPFNASQTGGTMRYVAIAEPVARDRENLSATQSASLESFWVEKLREPNKHILPAPLRAISYSALAENQSINTMAFSLRILDGDDASEYP